MTQQGTGKSPFSDPFLNYTDATSLGIIPPQFTTRIVRYGNLQIVVDLTRDGKFEGIREVRVIQDFLSPEQRIASSGYHPVEDYYKEE